MSVGVLLAAGLGTRFDPAGECLKLLQPVAAGRHVGVPIVVAAARNLKTSVERALAVVRPQHHPHQTPLHDLLRSEGYDLVICEQAASGLGASLARGVRASPDADGWIVALGDMPAILPATIDAIAQALRAGHATVAPALDGRRGHPVGFAARCFSDLAVCDGDQGARGVLEKFPPYLVAVDDGGILIDIDHR